MKGKHRRHEPEFKARVALEAIKGVKTIQEIAKDFDIHPVQASEWKKTMAYNALAFSVQGQAEPKPSNSNANASASTQKSASKPLNWTGWQKKSKQLGL
jgi:transposase